jgi:hypothetical protein
VVIYKLIINKLENFIYIYIYILEQCEYSWLKVVVVVRRHRVHGRGGDRRLNIERGDLQVLCLLLHSSYTSLYGVMRVLISCLN